MERSAVARAFVNAPLFDEERELVRVLGPPVFSSHRYEEEADMRSAMVELGLPRFDVPSARDSWCSLVRWAEVETALPRPLPVPVWWKYPHRGTLVEQELWRRAEHAVISHSAAHDVLRTRARYRSRRATCAPWQNDWWLGK